MRAIQHFHRGLLLMTQRKRKEFQRNTQKYFWSFSFSEESKNKNEKNYLHEKAPNKQKKNKEILLGFLLILQLIKLERKTEKKQDFFWIFSKFFKHTRRKRENKSSMDTTMKKCEHRQLERNV